MSGAAPVPPSPPSMVTKSTPLLAVDHLVGEVVPELQVSDRRLDADGQPGLGGQQLDPVEQAVGVGELGVTGRADAVLAHRDPAGGGDLRRHLGRRQQAAEAGLGALGQLDLEGPHRRRRHHVLEPGEVEATVVVPAPEVGRPDLEDQVAAVAVVAGETTLTRVLGAAGKGGATVERLDGGARQRAEAHRREVHHRVLAERARPAAGRAEHLGARHPCLLTGRRRRRRRHPGERGVLHDRVRRRVLDVVVGAEAEVVVLELRRGVHPPSLVTTERTLLVVAGHHVLAQLGTDRLDEVAGVADHREVAQQGVTALDEVVHGDGADGEDGRSGPQDPPHG